MFVQSLSFISFVMFIIMSSTSWNFLLFWIIFAMGNLKGHVGIAEVNREVVEKQGSNSSPRTLEEAAPCELVHRHNRGATFIWWLMSGPLEWTRVAHCSANWKKKFPLLSRHSLLSWCIRLFHSEDFILSQLHTQSLQWWVLGTCQI
jgi:hypothetical protein